MSSQAYREAGVDTKKAAQLIARFKKDQRSKLPPQLLSGIGPFAACWDLSRIAAKKNPVLVTSCDGVGTKLKLALEWASVEGLGQDLVAMNVNDLLCVGALPELFLDYYACDKVQPKLYLSVLKSIARACKACGAHLVGGETAEMPGLYQGKDFDLAGFAIGFAEKKNLLGPSKVKVNDLIFGFKSSGFHSNGYSLIRKLVKALRIRPDQKPSFSKKTWRELLLEPTVLYPPVLKKSLGHVHALCHVTGGGLYENFPRVLPKNLNGVFFKSQWLLPPMMEWFQKNGKLKLDDLFHTFNCGYGLLSIVSHRDTETFLDQFQDSTVKPELLGFISDKGTSSVSWQ